ncbi:MAG TPA: iron-containing alcohol dehydrogenase [Polyangiaceae bacterium]|jgi:alcohol dehydrogenase class IV|nr:iron-containing alcohol dehydrogenase [Polyangiaceae bacterium]
MSAAGFEFAHRTKLVFGAGVWTKAFAEVQALGRKVLLVTGARSLGALGLEPALNDEIARFGLNCVRFSVSREPDIELADGAAALARTSGAEAVLAIGGGSALDVAKAAAALGTNPGSARDYVEGLASPPKPIAIAPLPVVCVPTTAGTGSEVTKNAVLQVTDLFVKRSMRSELLFPRAAFVDPALSGKAPERVRAGSGFDALTHLCEAFCSKNASPMTDALARDGIPRAVHALHALAAGNAGEADALDLALAATLGGICLANAGLGAAHGLIAPLGGLYPNIPHGAGLACLLPTTLAVNAEAARADVAARARLDELAELLAGTNAEIARAATALVELRRALALPNLASYAEINVARVVASPSGSLKTNPVALTDAELRAILERALAN